MPALRRDCNGPRRSVAFASALTRTLAGGLSNRESRFERRTRNIVMPSASRMSTLSHVTFGVVLVVLIGCDPITIFPTRPPALSEDESAPVDRSINETPGRTECAPGRKGIIAPVPLHPVVEVLINPGDRVRKGQALVKLDDDEARAEVQVKRAALENARIDLQESRRYLGAFEKAISSVPDVTYQKARIAALAAEMHERSAEAALESAQAELQHYVVTAAIDGAVSWLDVSPGMVSRPGTTVWGEILDLREIEVRCELTVGEADRVSAGQPAVVRSSEGNIESGVGRVVFVGLTADKTTGLVPVVVRLSNPKERLRCGVPVHVRFDADHVESPQGTDSTARSVTLLRRPSRPNGLPNGRLRWPTSSANTFSMPRHLTGLVRPAAWRATLEQNAFS
jgi:RND family efflux transporter MFP subunit